VYTLLARFAGAVHGVSAEEEEEAMGEVVPLPAGATAGGGAGGHRELD
jgi:hypothetical protein